ncbi:hypothetical protein D3C87_410770 [compost metagenome]
MKDVKKDFQSFVKEEGSKAPSSLLAKIHDEIQKAAPSMGTVFVKLAGIHLVASLLSLMACPQFGVHFVNHGHGLMHYFMQISEVYCYILCGAFYLATTILLARMLLNFDEWLVIKRSRAAVIMTVALLSLGAFALHSKEVTLELALLWLFGAAVGGELISLSKTEWRNIPKAIMMARVRRRL